MTAKPLFNLGQISFTPAALEVLAQGKANAFQLLLRHSTGDWGELSAHDRRENEIAVKEGYRVWSSYPLQGGGKIWVITEADRSSTTFLLPDDY